LTPPALDVAPPAEPANVPENLVAASFGLLRAEPDGSVVIAGSGRPGSEVEVYSDDTLLGSTTVESSGDWVFVPDHPLPTGGVEITLAERGKEGKAAQSFVVVVNDDKSTQPLVVASTPGQASEILQGLAPPATTAVAAATPVTQPATTAVAAATPATQPAAAPSAAPVTTPAEPAPVAVAAAPAATPAAPATTTTPATTTPAPTETAAAASPAASSTPAETPATVAAAPTETPGPAAPAATTPPAAAPAATASTPETAVATNEPATPAAAPATPAAPAAPATAPATQLASVPPTIDAIEIEGNRTFFAGAGPDGGIVRLYVDDAFVADATIEGGRWLVEGGAVLKAPSQRVRADLLAPGSSEVIARAEVDFVVDMPEAQQPTAVASADAATSPAAPAASAAAPAASTPAQPAALPAQPAPAQPAATSAPAQPAATAPAEPATTQPAPSVPATPATPAAPAVAEAPATPQPAAQPAVPTMVAVSVGSPDAQRFASGKAIIRRGDNLWTIARRVYGEGVKYTTIYEANSGQIRDPDRIYPGQVFALPQ
jgi:nucleoid-associated protein YgaU